MNSLIWRGVSSTTIKGLLISELPPISKPPLRVQETTVDGRDGSIIEELGYSSYDKKVVIGLRGDFDINKVIKYFTGEGEVIFSNEPEKVYTAKIVGQIDYNRLLKYRQAVIPFRVQPFKHKYNEAYKETETATATGTNIVLNDSGKTPMRIETEAGEVVVYGKNIVDTNALALGTNTSLVVENNGYTITAKGGANSTYTYSKYTLPLALRGKTYYLCCDEIVSAKTVDITVQINVISPTGNTYTGLTGATNKKTVVIPANATKIELVICTNNTATTLNTDNVLVVKGLRLVCTKHENDAWCPFDGLQTLEVVDGVANVTGYTPVTVISNADNAEMTVEYTKHFEVFNEGLETSRPITVLKGEGTVGVSVNGVLTFEYTFPEGENEVVIDSQTEDAYLGDELKNRNMAGEFPILLPGTNIIEWSGAVSSIEILPRSRWL